MTDSIAVPSPWGDLIRASTMLTTGEVLLHDWVTSMPDPSSADGGSGAPEIMVRTTEPGAVAALVPRIAALLGRPETVRRATDAVVTEFSEEDPTAEELAEAAEDLLLQAVEAWPDGDVVLHLEDSCEEHFAPGYWPAVRFDSAGAIVEITVEA